MWQINFMIGRTWIHEEGDPHCSVKINLDGNFDYIGETENCFPDTDAAKAFCEKLMPLYKANGYVFYSDALSFAYDRMGVKHVFGNGIWYTYDWPLFEIAPNSGFVGKKLPFNSKYFGATQDRTVIEVWQIDAVRPLMRKLSSEGEVLETWPLAARGNCPIPIWQDTIKNATVEEAIGRFAGGKTIMRSAEQSQFFQIAGDPALYRIARGKNSLLCHVLFEGSTESYTDINRPWFDLEG